MDQRPKILVVSSRPEESIALIGAMNWKPLLLRSTAKVAEAAFEQEARAVVLEDEFAVEALEVQKRLTAEELRCPIILVIGDRKAIDFQELTDSGIEDILVRPTNKANWLNSLSHLLTPHR